MTWQDEKAARFAARLLSARHITHLYDASQRDLVCVLCGARPPRRMEDGWLYDRHHAGGTTVFCDGSAWGDA